MSLLLTYQEKSKHQNCNICTHFQTCLGKLNAFLAVYIIQIHALKRGLGSLVHAKMGGKEQKGNCYSPRYPPRFRCSEAYVGTYITIHFIVLEVACDQIEIMPYWLSVCKVECQTELKTLAQTKVHINKTLKKKS